MVEAQGQPTANQVGVRKLNRPQLEQEIDDLLTMAAEGNQIDYIGGKLTVLYWLLGDDWGQAYERARQKIAEVRPATAVSLAEPRK